MTVDASFWTVLRVKARREAYAEEHCKRQGFTTYVPLHRPSMLRRALEPLFRGYVFVLVQGSWWCLRSTYGVLHVVMHAGEPARLPTKIVDELRRREDKTGAVRPLNPPLVEGTPVNIVGGPFVGQQALFSRFFKQDQIEVLMKVLGCDTAVRIKAGYVRQLDS